MVFCPPGLATVATSVKHSDWLKVVCSVLKTTVPLVTGDWWGTTLKFHYEKNVLMWKFICFWFYNRIIFLLTQNGYDYPFIRTNYHSFKLN